MINSRVLRWYGLAAICASLALPASALAEEPSSVSTRSCVYYLQELGPPSLTGNIEATPVKEGCYANSSQATTMATSISPAGAILDGIDYGHIEWSGESLVWTSAHTCYEGYTLSSASMPSGWNDRVRSARYNASTCEFWAHFQNANFGEPKIVCTSSEECRTMGVMATQTSSERWHN